MTTNINADDGVVSGVAGLKTSADNSGVLALQTNGTTALTVNASQALGVGSTPSYGTSGQVLTSAGSGAPPTWTSASGSSQWTTSGSNIYYTTGNVGIGTATPTFATGGGLQVKDASFASVRVTGGSNTGLDISQTTTGSAYVYLRDNFPLVFGTSNAEQMRVDASGNLLVGTTSNPVSTRAVISNTGDGYALSIGDITTYTNRTGIYFRGGNENRLGWDSSGYLTFFTGATERARIDSSGNLLVALTSQVGAGTVCTTNSATKNGVVVKDSASGSYLYTGLNSSNSSVLLILGSGNVQNANNSYGAISDVKLKENIVDATPKLDKLMQVRVRNYNLKGDYEQHKQIGVIAQELETVFPAMVDETPDKDEEGNDLGTTTKSVKYSVFVPMLIKAIQELKTEFDAYKASHP